MKLKHLVAGFAGIVAFAAAIAKEFWGWPTTLKVVIILVPLAFLATLAILAVVRYNDLVAAFRQSK